MLKIFFSKDSTITIKTSRLPLKFVYLYFFNGIYKTMVYKKKTNLPIHWSSAVPKCYKHTNFESATDFEKLLTSYDSLIVP